jgi:hypothetical protein
MKLKFGILVLLPLFTMGQQNLVSNPSFEETTDCPSGMAQLSLSPNWSNPNQASPDYFHSCATNIYWGTIFNAFGGQIPHSGSAYVGGYCFSIWQENGREYVQAELTHPLEQGTAYLVSFYTSVADNGLYGISTIGAYLSVDAISSNDVYRFDVVPQVLNHAGPMIDSTTWVLVTDTFVSPLGGERYITIGNFNTDATSDTVRYNPTGDVSYVYAYYYIDDVSVVPLDGPVGVAPPGLPKVEGFSVYPNPAIETVNIDGKERLGHVQLVDIRGRELMAEAVNGQRHTLDLSGVPEGIYLLQVTDAEGRRATQRFIKM